MPTRIPTIAAILLTGISLPAAAQNDDQNTDLCSIEG